MQATDAFEMRAINRLHFNLDYRLLIDLAQEELFDIIDSTLPPR
jgi:hypothetical protein